MAAAAARCGLTAPPGEEKAGSCPVPEVEARSASPRSVEMLLIAAALVRVLLITFLALVSGAARGLMLSDVGPSSKAHSARSPTPWEVTTAGSRAADKAMTAELVSAEQESIMASLGAAATQIQRHVRGWAARDFVHGRLMARELMEAAAAALQHAWRGFAERAAAAAEEARMLEELWARPLPLPAQVLRDRWGALQGANMAWRGSPASRRSLTRPRTSAGRGSSTATRRCCSAHGARLRQRRRGGWRATRPCASSGHGVLRGAWGPTSRAGAGRRAPSRPAR